MNNLETLKLDRIREYLDTYISMVNEGKKDMVEALYELTNFEMELRNERAMNACVKVANFPYIKTFEDFDFSYQPSISKEQIWIVNTFLDNFYENILNSTGVL